MSSSDPGVANWLDTVGCRRGVVMLRYDGTPEGTFDPRARRKHVQIRFGN